MESILRPDEEFIRQRVESYLRREDPAMQIEANKPDPPDCYALSKGRRIPLEITRAEVEFEDGGVRKSNLSHVYSLFALVSDINARFRDSPSDYCLDIHIVGPVDNPRRFRRKLEDLIAALMRNSSSIAYDELRDFRDVDGERVIITKRLRKEGHDFLQSSIGQKNHVASCLIQDETDIIYFCTILRKERAMAAVEGEKWLAIYNGYPLAEEHNIRDALAKLARRHSFTRIFIVDGEDRIFEVEEQSSNSHTADGRCRHAACGARGAPARRNGGRGRS